MIVPPSEEVPVTLKLLILPLKPRDPVELTVNAPGIVMSGVVPVVFNAPSNSTLEPLVVPNANGVAALMLFNVTVL